MGGYGYLSVFGRKARAHRVSWELYRGPIPKDALVLHRCDVRSCINPDHLFLGSQQANVRDAVSKGRWHNQNVNKSHCHRGHSFDVANTYLTANGKRICRRCHMERNRRYRRDKGHNQ
jgi:predicted CXXCH cytochrome family protein